MEREALGQGYESVDQLAEQSPETFSQLAKQWRIYNERLVKSGEFRNNKGSDSIDAKLYRNTSQGDGGGRGSASDTLASAQAHLERSLRDGSGSSQDAGVQREALVQWADGNGRLVRKLPRGLEEKLFGEDQGGREHHAFYDEKLGRWIKATKGTGSSFGFFPVIDGTGWGLAPAPVDAYLKRLEESNAFSGDDVRLHAVWLDGRNLSLITSQPDVGGVNVSVDRIAEQMATRKFVDMGNGAFYREADNRLITDAHPGNLNEIDGILIPFDVNVTTPSAELLDAIRAGTASSK